LKKENNGNSYEPLQKTKEKNIMNRNELEKIN